MRADSFAGQVLAVISRRTPALQPDPNEPSTFPGWLRARGFPFSSTRRSCHRAAKWLRESPIVAGGLSCGWAIMAWLITRAKTIGLAALALLGTVGAFAFGVLAGEGGKGHLRNILLGVACVAIPAAITAVNRIVVNKRALRSKRAAEQQTAKVRIDAEARLIFALRAGLSPVLYLLEKIASSSGTQVAPLIGSLTQAIVSAAIEHRHPAESRRSIFFAVNGDLMECVSYAGYEGQQDTARTVFANFPEDPVGQYMFRLLGEREAVLIPNLDAAELPVRFPSRRSYQTIIATAVMAGESPYGILTLDAPQADSLGQPDLEIMKTLANLLGVGLALAARSERPALPMPPSERRAIRP